MNENDIIIIQRIMVEHSLSAETERRLLKMLEEGRREWTEKRQAPAAVMNESGVKYIDCPYSVQDRDLIMEWIYEHKYDAQALAVALWLEGGIASREIINLRRSDYRNLRAMDEATGFGQRVFQKWTRAEIVRKALKLHPEGLEFVFMYSKGTEWKKLTGGSIQTKMYNICDQVGIAYKPFRTNEAIKSE